VEDAVCGAIAGVEEGECPRPAAEGPRSPAAPGRRCRSITLSPRRRTLELRIEGGTCIPRRAFFALLLDEIHAMLASCADELGAARATRAIGEGLPHRVQDLPYRWAGFVLQPSEKPPPAVGDRVRSRETGSFIDLEPGTRLEVNYAASFVDDDAGSGAQAFFHVFRGASVNSSPGTLSLDPFLQGMGAAADPPAGGEMTVLTSIVDMQTAQPRPFWRLYFPSPGTPLMGAREGNWKPATNTPLLVGASAWQAKLDKHRTARELALSGACSGSEIVCIAPFGRTIVVPQVPVYSGPSRTWISVGTTLGQLATRDLSRAPGDLDARALRSVRVERLYHGRYEPVRVDAARRDIQRLPLAPGDRITW
jgi:hypothetical protein